LLIKDEFGPMEGIQIISQSSRIKQLYLTLIRSASSEILLIFPSINAIRREEKIGIIEELKRAASRGIKIRILTPEDDFIQDLLEYLRSNKINIRRIESSAGSKFKLLIIDRKISLVIETNDDSRSEFLDAVGLATISNSNPTVQPYVAIFEGFWKEIELYEKARNAERVKDEFVNIAAHELRTPIMPIIAGIELFKNELSELEKNVPLNPKMKEDIDSIFSMMLRNSTRLLQLSEDILQVSKIESGAFTLHIERVDFNSLIKQILNDIKKKYLARKEKVRFVVDSRLSSKPDHQFILFCDKLKITQALLNLIDNAIKFTEEGTISLSAILEDNHILVQVRDSGIGVDPTIKNQLFEKFVTKSEEGTGLGLYITRKIVEAHGGLIWLENNIDENGATFSFTLPIDLQQTGNRKAESTHFLLS